MKQFMQSPVYNSMLLKHMPAEKDPWMHVAIFQWSWEGDPLFMHQ